MQKPLIAGIAVGIILLISGGATAVQLSANSTAINPALGAPPVRVVSVSDTAIQLDYGPSQPGPFKAGVAKATSLVINWPASIDTLHPIGLTYTVVKDGVVINSGLVGNSIKVSFSPKIRSFRFCVKAVNSAGISSPFGCTTFIGQ